MTTPADNTDQHFTAGGQGNYAFTDLAQLNRIIDQWIYIREAARFNDKRLEQAIRPVFAPAGDRPSGNQAKRYVQSLEMARQHSGAMTEYASTYVDRLTASRALYGATEEDNVTRLGGN